tara:strand:- start:388 stop:912 length:525 start_codon:yes stop_codon:yes gene_type:complete
MKLTTKQLKQIIAEEVNKILIQEMDATYINKIGMMLRSAGTSNLRHAQSFFDFLIPQNEKDEKWMVDTLLGLEDGWQSKTIGKGGGALLRRGELTDGEYAALIRPSQKAPGWLKIQLLSLEDSSSSGSGANLEYVWQGSNMVGYTIQGLSEAIDYIIEFFEGTDGSRVHEEAIK